MTGVVVEEAKLDGRIGRIPANRERGCRRPRPRGVVAAESVRHPGRGGQDEQGGKDPEGADGSPVPEARLTLAFRDTGRAPIEDPAKCELAEPSRAYIDASRGPL